MELVMRLKKMAIHAIFISQRLNHTPAQATVNVARKQKITELRIG
jgi:hypothetical protein